MGGAGSGDSNAAALEDGVTVSSVDDIVGNNDDGKSNYGDIKKDKA